MPYDLSINDGFSAQTLTAGRERQPVLVIDDFLRDPEAMVRYAANEARFQPSTAMYPGIVAPVPDAYIHALLEVLGPMLGPTFGVLVDTAFLSDGFFAILTFPPEKLHFRQRLPHVDDYDPGMIAILHYFTTQGGTALYRHRATGYEALDREKNQRMQSLNAQEIAARPALPPEYMRGSNRLFEQTACLKAKFNRLIAYRGSILHSMVVDDNTTLNPNPRVGRLTTNVFLRFERA
jgi:Family of unknown function (DUF6445)